MATFIKTEIHYSHSDVSIQTYLPFLETLITSKKIRRVLEVGGGANPAFPLEFIARHGLDYAVMDVSAEELAKAPQGYRNIHADITSPGLDLPGGYDLIFSKMVAEHVKSGETFHLNVRRLLAPGGWSFHFFPTLYAPLFVANLLLPHRLTEKLLHYFLRGREISGRNAKFPAYYSWCRGPTSGQIKRFERLGYRVDQYIGFFGHDYYLKYPFLATMHRSLSHWLARHPLSYLCSYAYVLLQKE